MNKLAFGLLWLLTFVIPWEQFYTVPGIGTLGRVTGLVMFGAAAIDLLLRGDIRRPRPFDAVVVLFVLWAGVTFAWTIDQEATRNKVLTYGQLALFAWLIWELAPTDGRRAHLMQAYVLGAYVSVADTVLKFLSGEQAQTGRYAAANFNPNDLGFTLVLAIPLAWYLALARPRGLMTWVNRLYVPAGMFAILLTASRGSLIPALVALLIVPWTLSQHRVRTRVAISLLVLLSLVALGQLVPQTSWERLSTTTREIGSGDLNYRGTIWRAGVQVFLGHPWIGVGAGAYGAAVEPIIGAPRAPHQTFLSVLVGQGLVGLVLFFAVFFVAFRAVLRLPVQSRKLWIVMLLTLAIGLQSRGWDYAKPLWLVLGLVAAETALAARRDATAPLRAPAPARPWRAWQPGAAQGAAGPVDPIAQHPTGRNVN